MDLLQDIRRKSTALEGHQTLEGINAVIRHIEVADRYLSQARVGNEEDLFNDVIYRTNQASEGILKEAYSVLTSQDGSNLSPNQIEQHLVQGKVLAARVLELFKNYRQNWRNPSTHNHKLFFGEQEALLAIVSVSAFANILLDQIIEAINRKREQERLSDYSEKLREAVNRFDAMSFPERVIQFTVINNPLIVSEHSRLRPDLILKHASDEDIVIEVKRSRFNKNILAHGTAQLLSYLEATGGHHGVLYIPSGDPDVIDVKTVTAQKDDQSVFIHYIVPKHLL